MHFILVSIAETIFYFQGIHEQFHIGYCVWNVSLLHPAHKDFIGISPSSIPAFLHFILVSIGEIFFFYGIHGQFHLGCCVSNISLLHPTRKVFIGIISSQILAFLDFIHEQFHIGCCVWNLSVLQMTRKVFIGIIPFPILFFFYFILVSIFHFYGSHK